MMTCSGIKRLSPSQMVEWSLDSHRINPLNAPNPRGALRLNLIPSHIAMLTTAYWGSAGVKLGVGFMENTTVALQNKILSFANLWGRNANVKFVPSSLSNADIRLSRGPGGYYSYLGSQCRHIPRNQQTMNLEQFVLSTPESEYFRVVCHEFGHCLDGDTMIDCPRDLDKHPLGIPIKELVGKTPWVYCWKNGSLTVRKASRVWLSKRNVRTIRVRLSSGQGLATKAFLPPLELVGTPDHPVLLSDGVTWKNLGDLKKGDRLCSMYRSKNGSRSRIRWTNGGERVREHTFVCERVFGQRPDGHDCHHKNENKMDQSVNNLEWKDESKHVSDHSRGRKIDPEVVARRADKFRGYRHTEESKRKMSEAPRPSMSIEQRESISRRLSGKPQSAELVEKRMAGVRRLHERKRQAAIAANHTVISIEEAGTRDVYDMTVPDADSFVANGVVVHNSLGFVHEHARPAAVKLLDPAKVIPYFERTQGWSKTEIRQQILDPIDEKTLTSTAVELTSIMAYEFDADLTFNGVAIPGGTRITDNDASFCAQRYPLAVTPPSPPIPPATTVPPILSSSSTLVINGSFSTITLNGVTIPVPKPKETQGESMSVIDTIKSIVSGVQQLDWSQLGSLIQLIGKTPTGTIDTLMSLATAAGVPYAAQIAVLWHHRDDLIADYNKVKEAFDNLISLFEIPTAAAAMSISPNHEVAVTLSNSVPAE